MSEDFILKRIELKNFYLYKGKVSIDFTSSDSTRNFFLFVFQNGGGKTSLYHAIKWGFYGNKFRYFKEEREVKPKDMINDYAKQNNEGFYVQIEFYLNGSEYTLRRTCENPNVGADTVELTTPSGTLFNNDAREKLDIIVPSDYGQFFMFDGRDLSSLAKAQDDRAQVDGIIKLLGLSSVQVLKDKLVSIRDGFNESLRSYNRNNEDKTASENEYNSYCQLEKDKQTEIEGVVASLYEVQQRIDSYTENINNAKDIQPLITKKHEIEARREEALGYKQSAYETLVKVRKNIHICLLDSEFKRIIADDEDGIKSIQDATGLDDLSLKGLEISKEIIDHSLSICPSCTKPLNASDYESIKKSLYQNEQKLKLQALNNEKYNLYNNDKHFFEKLLSHDYNAAYLALIRYDSECVKIADYERQLSEIDAKISCSGFEEIERWQSNLDEAKDKKRELELSKGQMERDKANFTRKKEAAMTKMQREGFSDSEIKVMVNRISFCDKMIRVLDDVIKSNIAKMREQILEESNKFFKDMTNKPQIYDHLEYVQDSSYLMVIVKKDGTKVPLGSTGELQIVTMSFLMALSKCSGKTTPIVMDTPSTNLDVIHSQGVQRSLKTIPSQIIFLAQPAESTDKFIEDLKDITAKIFEVEFDEHGNGNIKEAKI